MKRTQVMAVALAAGALLAPSASALMPAHHTPAGNEAARRGSAGLRAYGTADAVRAYAAPLRMRGGGHRGDGTLLGVAMLPLYACVAYALAATAVYLLTWLLTRYVEWKSAKSASLAAPTYQQVEVIEVDAASVCGSVAALLAAWTAATSHGPPIAPPIPQSKEGASGFYGPAVGECYSHCRPDKVT